PYGNILTSLYILIMAYAIIKHRVIEISFVVSNFISRIITLLIILASYYSIHKFIFSTILVSENKFHTIIFNICFFAVAFELYSYINDKIKRLSNSLIIPTTYNLQDFTQQLGHAFEKSVSIKDLSMVIKSSLQIYLKTTNIRFYLREDFLVEDGQPDKYLEYGSENKTYFENEIIINEVHQNKQLIVKDESEGILKKSLNNISCAICVPCIANKKVIALLILGHKEEKEGNYTSLDLKVFDYLRYQLGIVLDRMHAYEQIKEGFERNEKIVSIFSMMGDYLHELKSNWISVFPIIYPGKNDTEELKNIKKEVKQVYHRENRLVDTMAGIMTNSRYRYYAVIDVAKLIDTVLMMFAPPVKKIVKEYDENVPPIYGDKEDIGILFSNLLKNAYEAIRATYNLDDYENYKDYLEAKKAKKPHPSGYEEAIMFRVYHLKKEERVGIEVEDTGCGMTEEQLQNFWEKGFSTKKGKGGTGVGTAFIKRIVQENNGDITVESRKDIGTKFIISIPVYKKET
ncbi:MAG: GHKL domain-containing protein, partial [bacterium]|nr:GHKL domain-containing protein [bacterium]